jgi:hypothetical protein
MFMRCVERVCTAERGVCQRGGHVCRRSAIPRFHLFIFLCGGNCLRLIRPLCVMNFIPPSFREVPRVRGFVEASRRGVTLYVSPPTKLW